MVTDIDHRALKDTINQCHLVVCERGATEVGLVTGGNFNSRCTPFGEMSIITLVTPNELSALRRSLENAKIGHRVYKMRVKV